MDYPTYLLQGLKIFILVFILGNIIDQIFAYVQKKYNIPKSKVYGLLQLVTIITIAYIIHANSNNKISHEFQIYNPTVLFSSLMLNIQNTMFYNFSLNLETHLSHFLPI